MTPRKTLDDYQIVSRDFLLNTGKFVALLDEPGVGKTGPAIMASYQVRKDGGFKAPVLITVPAYLINNWKKEIHDFIPHAKVVSADGTGFQARREAFLSVDADFVLTSYNNWGSKVKGTYQYPELADTKWSAYIFDEGHRLRGRNSSWTKHVFRTRLANSPNRETPIYLLTGTPFVRDGGDFFPYFHLHNKKKYGSYWKFVQDRCITVDTPWGTDVRNIRKSYTEEFKKELAEFSLRRTVKEIPQLENLEFQETWYETPTPPSVVKAIRKAKKEYVLEHPDMGRAELFESAGALYVAQRQIATDPPTKVKPKIDWLKDFLADRKGQVVVYTWFKNSARMVHEAIGSTNGRLAYLATGDMTPSRRAASVDLWREDSTGVLVATIPALKEGISLTEANEVVFLEHSELPADLEQCIKRLCRRGQKKIVQVHHVDAEKTVDMAIRKVLTSRTQGINEVLANWLTADEEQEDEWFN